MNIYKTLNIGSFHTNYCEDFLVEEPMGSNVKLIAVLDGCTMGTESAFASMLFGKILRQIAKQHYYQEFILNESPDLKSILKETVNSLFAEIKVVKNRLGLEINELLSTLVLGVVDFENNRAEFLTIGDGLIYVDGKSFEYEQNDKPDYLGYHLNENFELWYSRQEQWLSLSSFKDLSICTDGIFIFKT